MRKSVLLICVMIGLYAGNCIADAPVIWDEGSRLEGCDSWICLEGQPEQWYSTASPGLRKCKEYTAMCVYQSGSVFGVSSCSTCEYGFELRVASSGITACYQSDNGNDKGDDNGDDNGNGGVNSYSYTECYQNCKPTNCADDTNWRSGSTGYQVRTERSCSVEGPSGICNGVSKYRCAAGYYGSSED